MVVKVWVKPYGRSIRQPGTRWMRLVWHKAEYSVLEERRTSRMLWHRTY